MIELGYRYDRLLQQAIDQEITIKMFLDLENADESVLREKFDSLENYFDFCREKLSEEIDLNFNNDRNKCSIIVNSKVQNIDDPEILEYLAEVKKNGEKITAEDMRLIGYDDEWLIEEMPDEPDDQMVSFGVRGKADSYAVLAYVLNQESLDLLKFVKGATFNDIKNDWDYQIQSFIEASEASQIKNLLTASSGFLKASNFLRYSQCYKKKEVFPKIMSEEMKRHKEAQKKYYGSKGGREKQRRNFLAIKGFVFDWFHKSEILSIRTVVAEMQESILLFIEDLKEPSIIAETNLKRQCEKWFYEHRNNCPICEKKWPNKNKNL